MHGIHFKCVEYGRLLFHLEFKIYIHYIDNLYKHFQ